MKSKTKIEKQTIRKTNPELVQTIISAKKSKEWLKVADILSGSRRNRLDLNIEKIGAETKAGDIVVFSMIFNKWTDNLLNLLISNKSVLYSMSQRILLFCSTKLKVTSNLLTTCDDLYWLTSKLFNTGILL